MNRSGEGSRFTLDLPEVLAVSDPVEPSPPVAIGERSGDRIN